MDTLNHVTRAVSALTAMILLIALGASLALQQTAAPWQAAAWIVIEGVLVLLAFSVVSSLVRVSRRD